MQSLLLAAFVFSRLAFAAPPLALKEGIFTDGQHDVQVREQIDERTNLKWYKIFIRFGRLGFYFNPRAGEIADWPFGQDPLDPVTHAAPLPFVLETKREDGFGIHYRWRQGNLWAAVEAVIEMSVDPQGSLLALRGIEKEAMFAAPTKLGVPHPQYHSGPLKTRRFAYACEGLRPVSKTLLNAKCSIRLAQPK